MNKGNVVKDKVVERQAGARSHRAWQATGRSSDFTTSKWEGGRGLAVREQCDMINIFERLGCPLSEK